MGGGRPSPSPPWPRPGLIIAAAVAMGSRPCARVCIVSDLGSSAGGLQVTDEPEATVQGHPTLVHLGPAGLFASELGIPSCAHGTLVGVRRRPLGRGPVGLVVLDLLSARWWWGGKAGAPGDRGKQLGQGGKLVAPCLLETARVCCLASEAEGVVIWGWELVAPGGLDSSWVWQDQVGGKPARPQTLDSLLSSPLLLCAALPSKHSPILSAASRRMSHFLFHRQGN